MSAVLLTPDLRVERVDMKNIGIVQYHQNVNGHMFITEMRRLLVTFCTCHIHNCQHSKVAVREETHYLSLHTDKPAHCESCGWMCMRVNGIALCPACAGF